MNDEIPEFRFKNRFGQKHVLDIFDDILELINQKPGYKTTCEPLFLRHFTAHFEPVGKEF